jgi:hypothetical protein
MYILDLWRVAYHAVQASFTGREVAGLATLEGISETDAIVDYCYGCDSVLVSRNYVHECKHVFEVRGRVMRMSDCCVTPVPKLREH